MWMLAAVAVFLSLTASHAAHNYGDALGKSILFYDAQRSGKLPGNNPIKWRGDSGLHDCVTGGWYDAGDNVKFGFPMAASTTLLAWGFIRFHDGYTSAGKVGQMYDSLKWPLDYFLKAWNPGSRKLVVQVGDGNKDHSHWSRPEDMSTDRPCYSVDSSHKGSDVAAETAAAMAAGSLAFKAHDGGYAGKLLHAAESLYDFAKSHRGIYSQSISQAAAFYSSSGDKDEMCVAAMWLYKATRQAKYLNDAKSFHENAWGWALSWDDKKIACQLLLFEETKSSAYRAEVEGFFKGWLPGGSISYTPCGMAWRDKWGSNRYAGNAAFAALIAAEDGIQATTYRKWAAEQINYLLGDNSHNGQQCYSYEIGVGSHYPKQPHHRAASCPDLHQHCSFEHLNTNSPNPHTLVGALVGGPDQHDSYNDKRDDYVKNEVACDYNSGFQGALAGIVHLQHNHHMPTTHNKCPCH
ncbi:endoglucanase E-4-like [Littorina saxatilis]|uniref:Endoglucanase n=1 Tax=Littorina saxatilis TaxID=31220 RepID=A0AAN9AVF0_9CAEN